MDITTVTVGRRTLEDTPERALQFIRGVSRTAGIRVSLQTRGYTQEEHVLGWTLIGQVSGVDLAVSEPVEDEAVRQAMTRLNQADEETLTIVDASLRHRHPAQAEALTKGLSATRDEAEAVVVMEELLNRVDNMAQSSDEADQSALQVLEARGLDAQERTRLRELVSLAKRAAPVAQKPSPEQAAAAEARYLEDLKRLRAWYEEWSELARVTIKRRDHLIQLGLASRRSPNQAEAAEAESFPDAGA